MPIIPAQNYREVRVEREDTEENSIGNVSYNSFLLLISLYIASVFKS